MLAVPAPALAQSVELQVPSRILVAEPFFVDLMLHCPPPGEAPPPAACNGIFVYFETSDRTAAMPSGSFFLNGNAPLRFGPFAYHRRGTQVLVLNAEEYGPLGGIELLVESRRRK